MDHQKGESENTQSQIHKQQENINKLDFKVRFLSNQNEELVKHNKMQLVQIKQLQSREQQNQNVLLCLECR